MPRSRCPPTRSASSPGSGLADELAANSTIPTELIYRHWQDGSRIAAHPVREDNWYEKRFGAPVLRDPPRRPAEDARAARSARAPAPRLPAGQPRPGARLGRAGVRQRPRRARRHRRRRRRRALHGPAVGHRGRRRRLLRDQRLPRHRADREPAVAARPARHPVLDGTGRPPAALRHRRQRRVGELLRGRRDPEDLVAPRLDRRRPRGRCRSPRSGAGTRPSPR